MSKGFWSQLKRPVMVVAPMSGVTDAAYRRIIAKYGKPDVMWTEFVPADGICSAGLERLAHDLWFTEAEKPILGQIYGCNPDKYREAAKLLIEMGFDGVDINMGCPARDVEKRRAGAALIKMPELAKEIILAARDGAGGSPVSVKTRIGYRTNTIDEWLATLIEAGPAAITIHARTRNEQSRVPARWGVVAQAAALAKEIEPDDDLRPLILGNGDVMSRAEAEQRVAETGCDGVMIGRGIFGNPWLFSTETSKEELSVPEILDVMMEHTATYLELFKDLKPIELMKKHFKAYVNGFEGASQLRISLMAARDYAELHEITQQFCRETSRYDLRRAPQPSEVLSSV